MQKITCLILLTGSLFFHGFLKAQSSPTDVPKLAESELLQTENVDKDDIVTFTDSAKADLTDEKGLLTLSGESQVRRNDAILKGDTIKYNLDTGLLEAIGNARLYRNGTLVTGEEVSYNVDKDTGRMISPIYSLAQGGSGFAKEAHVLDDNHMRLFDAQYSACDCEDQTWWITGTKVDLYDDENEGIARNGTLYVKGVPVFWSPWLTFPVRDEKKSGFLMPTFGYSSRSGADVQIPYFINLAPNYDATLTPRYLSKRGALLSSEFRYLMPSYAGQINAEYMPNDKDRDIKRWIYSIKHKQSLGQALGFKFGLNIDWNKASDHNYVRDLSQIQIYESDRSYLNQNVNLNFSGYKYWSGYLRFEQFQGLHDLDDRNRLRYRGKYEKKPELMIKGSRYNWYGFDVSTVNTLTRFTHPRYPELHENRNDSRRGKRWNNKPEGTRFSSYSSVSYPIIKPGWFFTPKAGLHLSHYETDWYSFNAQSGQQRNSQTRALPIISLDSGMTFERNTTLFGNNSIQTLEPRLYYLYVPYRDQSDLPIYDTDYMHLNFASVFAENAYAGGWDRIRDANQLTMGLTTRWLDEDTGFERLTAQIAQRFYFADQRVRLPGEKPREKTKSEVLANLSANLTDTLKTEVGLQYDPYEKGFSQVTSSVRWAPKRLASVALSYRFQRDPLYDEKTNRIFNYQLPARKSISGSFQWPFSENINAVGRLDYDLEEKRSTQSLLGVEYKGDCCWKTRFVFQRVAISRSKANSSVYFQVELSGLGSVGSSDPVKVMQKNVRGYQDPNLPPYTRSTFERYE